jgi:hypothetical protein
MRRTLTAPAGWHPESVEDHAYRVQDYTPPDKLLAGVVWSLVVALSEEGYDDVAFTVATRALAWAGEVPSC